MTECYMCTIGRLELLSINLLAHLDNTNLPHVAVHKQSWMGGNSGELHCQGFKKCVSIGW
jgi:hypothetical protein